MFTGSVRPFRLSFHTNAVEMPNDMGNRGFCLNYIQQPCNANNAWTYNYNLKIFTIKNNNKL